MFSPETAYISVNPQIPPISRLKGLTLRNRACIITPCGQRILFLKEKSPLPDA